MCRAVRCGKCGKMGWAGCGRHVEEVLRGVPKAERCEGHAGESGGGFFARMLRR